MADAIKTLQPNDPPQLREAFALEGLKDIVGGKHEPEVVQFFADTGTAAADSFFDSRKWQELAMAPALGFQF